MLGYGSLIDSSNTGKAAITKKYLGVDTLGDAANPLVYQSSRTVNALPFPVTIGFRRFIMTSLATVNGRNTRLMLIMLTIGPALVRFRWLQIWFSCAMLTILRTISWVCFPRLNMAR